MNKRTAIVLASAALITAGAAAGAASIGHGTSAAKAAPIAAGPTTTLPSITGVGPVPWEPPPVPPDGSTGTTTTTAQPGTTTTTVQPGPACRNSTDPACGDFGWDPAPGPNAPMTATVQVSPAHPAIGQKVTFTIHAHDDDAGAGLLDGWGFGDGPNVSVDYMRPTCDRYGPWTPPERVAHDWDETQTHVYSSAGTFHASFALESATPGIEGCSDPYASVGGAEADVTVTPTATQQSQNGDFFSCDGPSGSATQLSADEEQPPLQFYAYGGCPSGDPSQAVAYADVTNQGDQTVIFPKGVDVLVHIDGNGTRQDVHLTDPATTSLAPGQHVHLSKSISVERTGSYVVSGTVTYQFPTPPPDAQS